MDIASDNDFVPQRSLAMRDNGHGGNRKRDRMDLDSNSSSQMDDCDSYSSQRSDAPKLKSTRHDPVYQYDNSYRFCAGSQSSTNSDNDTTALLHSQSQLELLSSSNNTLRERERSSDALENNFSQRIAIAPPLTPDAANIPATTTNSTSAASASNAWSLKSRVGDIATPGSSDREDSQVYTPSTSEEVATGSSDASGGGGGGDVNYSLMNSILRDLRLGRQQEQEQERQQEYPAGFAPSPSQRSGQGRGRGQGSRCSGSSGGGRWSGRTRLAPASTVGATTTSPSSSSSSDFHVSSSDPNLLSLQRRFLLDYEKRMKEEDEASRRSSRK